MTNDEAIQYLEYLRDNYRTNADMIRNMSDEEMAAFFNKETLGLTSVCEVPCEIYDVTGHCFVSECYDAFLKWLKQEADSIDKQ